MFSIAKLSATAMLLSSMALILKNFGDFETDTYRRVATGSYRTYTHGYYRFGNGRLLNEKLIEN
jgi:hypothetical protein